MIDVAWRPETAERAIQAFERIHGLNVTVHDIAGNFVSFLRPNRSYHRSPLCIAVKAQGHHLSCLQFEIDQVRRDLAGLPEGRIHICHAGVVEWVVPIFHYDKLCWVLFAGPRLPGRDLSSAIPSTTSLAKHSWGMRAIPVPEVQEQEALLILEHLRQLGARLQFWCEGATTAPEESFRSTVGEASGSATTMARKSVIARFIDDHYAETATLAMLAKQLRLSEGRTSHVVRESCNRNFRDLLVQKRLRVAMELLRQSGMSVAEVAQASGFEDVAHFHRLFRRRVGHTPSQHRINGQS